MSNNKKIVMIAPALQKALLDFFESNVTIGDGVDLWHALKQGQSVDYEKVRFLFETTTKEEVLDED